MLYKLGRYNCIYHLLNNSRLYLLVPQYFIFCSLRIISLHMNKSAVPFSAHLIFCPLSAQQPALSINCLEAIIDNYIRCLSMRTRPSDFHLHNISILLEPMNLILQLKNILSVYRANTKKLLIISAALNKLKLILQLLFP